MSIGGTIAFIKLLLSLRDLIDGVLDNLIKKQNAADLAVIEKEILVYSQGKTVEEKQESAEKIKRMFNSHSD